jgi:hypothetical protein
MANAQQATDLRSRLIDSGFFATVVLDEQTPTPDRQRVLVRFTAQWKPNGQRPAITSEPLPKDSRQPGAAPGHSLPNPPPGERIIRPDVTPPINLPGGMPSPPSTVPLRGPSGSPGTPNLPPGPGPGAGASPLPVVMPPQQP